MNLVVWLSLIVSTLIKVLAIWGNNFAFTIDQGRDMVDVRNIVVGLHPTLVGPTTSINGLFLGPFYYYFISIPFALFRGHPQSVLLWQIVCFQLASIFLYLTLKRKAVSIARIVTVLLLLSPVGFYTARYFWNANLMPAFTILYFAAFYHYLSNPNGKWASLLGFISGISLQIEAAFGILFYPFVLLFLLIKKSPIKQIILSVLAFVITLVPQILFELRHGFIMTNTFLAELSGQSDILGEKPSLTARLFERQGLLINLLRDSNHISFELLLPIIIFLLIYGVYIFIRSKDAIYRNLILIPAGFIAFSFIFYLVFPQQVKGWYVLGLTIPIIVVMSFVIGKIFDQHLLGKLAVMLFLLFTTYHALIAQTQYIKTSTFQPSSDPSNFRNQLTAIDWVYQKANGRSFMVYNYLPSVYDYPYQYLFWWYGTSRYNYQPSDVAYLPNQPEYIKNQHDFWTQAKPADVSSPTYLIIEHDPYHQDRQQSWLGNFAKLCPISTQNIVPDLKVVELSPCPIQIAK